MNAVILLKRRFEKILNLVCPNKMAAGSALRGGQNLLSFAQKDGFTGLPAGCVSCNQIPGQVADKNYIYSKVLYAKSLKALNTIPILQDDPMPKITVRDSNLSYCWWHIVRRLEVFGNIIFLRSFRIFWLFAYCLNTRLRKVNVIKFV